MILLYIYDFVQKILLEGNRTRTPYYGIKQNQPPKTHPIPPKPINNFDDFCWYNPTWLWLLLCDQICYARLVFDLTGVCNLSCLLSIGCTLSMLIY